MVQWLRLCAANAWGPGFNPGQGTEIPRDMAKRFKKKKKAAAAAREFGEASVQFSSVAQSCPTLRDPMNRSTPGLPVHHQLQEFTQTYVPRVGDAIQPSHPLSSSSPPAPNPSS